MGRMLPIRAHMADAGKKDPPAIPGVKGVQKGRLTRGQSLRLAWVLFVICGLPLGLMASLQALAANHIYVEPLRQFWQPWPSDLAKLAIGLAAFGATLAYLTYRFGQSAGYRSGTVAATAAVRNLAEVQRVVSTLAIPNEMPKNITPAPPDIPAPPPQMP